MTTEVLRLTRDEATEPVDAGGASLTQQESGKPDPDVEAYSSYQRATMARHLGSKIGLAVAKLDELADKGIIEHDTLSPRFRGTFIRRLEQRRNRRRRLIATTLLIK